MDDDDVEATREYRAVQLIIGIVILLIGAGIVLSRDDFDLGAVAVLGGALAVGIFVGWRSRPSLPNARILKR